MGRQGSTTPNSGAWGSLTCGVQTGTSVRVPLQLHVNRTLFPLTLPMLSSSSWTLLFPDHLTSFFKTLVTPQHFQLPYVSQQYIIISPLAHYASTIVVHGSDMLLRACFLQFSLFLNVVNNWCMLLPCNFLELLFLNDTTLEVNTSG